MCSFLLPALASVALSLAAPAQCTNPWGASSGTPGVLGGTRAVNAVCEWDRDGAGPLPPVVVVGGDFSIAGDVAANRIAAFDASTDTWSPIGGGIGGVVRALQVLPNGQLVAGGSFSVGRGIYYFDGLLWNELGGGIVGDVRALALLPNGDLVAAGYFQSAGGVSAANIARWNGTAWAPLGAGVVGNEVRALAVMPNGDLIAGGFFGAAGGAPAANIARWDGTTWSPLAAGLDSAVQTLLVRSNGDLVAGGFFEHSGPSSGASLRHTASWDGISWTGFGAGVAGPAWSLAELANGDLVAGCILSQQPILKWNGAAWVAMNLATDDISGVSALFVLANGDLIAAGGFSRVAGVGAGGVARWNGASWSPLGDGLTRPLVQLDVLADDRVLGFGAFTVGQSRGLGVWTGATWQPFAAPLDGITCIRHLPDGNLLAAGVFPSPGGARYLALWNGITWSTFAPGLTGVGPSSSITGVDALPGGQIVVCGSFPQGLAVWNGSAWASMGAVTGPAPAVLGVDVTAAGDLVVAGYFSAIGGVPANNIARWDGSSWAPLGPGFTLQPFGGWLSMFTALPDGDVVIGGAFLVAGAPFVGVVRWDGAAWSAVGDELSGVPYAAVALPNGDLVVGGTFSSAGGTPASNLARWNGAAWSPFGAGTDARVRALAVRGDGDVMVGGDFLSADGMPSPYFAEITTTCPASAVVSGAGCTGSGGANVLTAESLPWLGATFRARATGLPPASFALIATGVTPLSLPLAQLFPQGLPGCTAWLLADVLGVALPSAGAVTTQIAVPRHPSLVGAQVHQQVLSFVFDVSGQLVELTGSNALTLTLGAF